MSNVHVRPQIRRDPVQLVPADAGEAHWVLAIDIVERDGQFDFRLLLNRIDQTIVRAALETDHLSARVDLSGNDGGHQYASVDPPAIEWSARPR